MKRNWYRPNLLKSIVILPGEVELLQTLRGVNLVWNLGWSWALVWKLGCRVL